MCECSWRAAAFGCPVPAFVCSFKLTPLASTAIENAFNKGIAVDLNGRDHYIREEIREGGTEV